jgi:hypothetical protein
MIHRKIDHLPNPELAADRFENVVSSSRIPAAVVTPQEP